MQTQSKHGYFSTTDLVYSVELPESCCFLFNWRERSRQDEKIKKSLIFYMVLWRDMECTEVTEVRQGTLLY